MSENPFEKSSIDHMPSNISQVFNEADYTNSTIFENYEFSEEQKKPTQIDIRKAFRAKVKKEELSIADLESSKNSNRDLFSLVSPTSTFNLSQTKNSHTRQSSDSTSILKKQVSPSFPTKKVGFKTPETQDSIEEAFGNVFENHEPREKNVKHCSTCQCSKQTDSLRSLSMLDSQFSSTIKTLPNPGLIERPRIPYTSPLFRPQTSPSQVFRNRLNARLLFRPKFAHIS